jgi:hypothetical protein
MGSNPLDSQPANIVSRRAYIGGDGGIRTLDRALQPYNGLANRRLQPLGHISVGPICPTRWPAASDRLQPSHGRTATRPVCCTYNMDTVASPIARVVKVFSAVLAPLHYFRPEPTELELNSRCCGKGYHENSALHADISRRVPQLGFRCHARQFDMDDPIFRKRPPLFQRCQDARPEQAGTTNP